MITIVTPLGAVVDLADPINGRAVRLLQVLVACTQFEVIVRKEVKALERPLNRRFTVRLDRGIATGTMPERSARTIVASLGFEYNPVLDCSYGRDLPMTIHWKRVDKNQAKAEFCSVGFKRPSNSIARQVQGEFRVENSRYRRVAR